jgi:hypothetical protein
MKHTAQHRNFMAQLEAEAHRLKQELLRQAAGRVRPKGIQAALRATFGDRVAAPLAVRREFVARHLPKVGSKSEFARAFGITRNRFRYLIGEAT